MRFERERARTENTQRVNELESGRKRDVRSVGNESNLIEGKKQKRKL